VPKPRARSIGPPPPVRPESGAPARKSRTGTARPKNRLLAALPADVIRRILPDLVTVPMTIKHVFHKRGQPIRHVYFPNGGVCSVTAAMKNGAAVEVATVGDEGMLGISAFWGDAVMATGETLCQVKDTSAEQMTVEAFRREVDRKGAFHEAVGRYSQGALALMMQSTACLALHGLKERCCRWLLMTQDRVRSNQFDLSHEFMAILLGATRPTVTVVAGELQKAGLIRYKYARITILDRKKLEAASCECYGTIKAEFDRLKL
jgi:CRP-like cAMP-binding protein